MGKLEFKKATKSTARARVALTGPAGSGKTYTALAIAAHLGQRVAVIDTEHGSASKYAGIFSFDVLELDSFAPAVYVEALDVAESAGFDVVVVDSLSHAWMGKDGALEQVDRFAKRSPSGNTFGAWRDVTPQHNALVEAMLACRAHLIVTMRSKTEYVLEVNDRGKQVPRKIGMAPIQRDGLEYEFDVVADLTLDNDLVIGKTRCPELRDQVYRRAGEDVATVLRTWLQDGVPAVDKPKAEKPKAVATDDDVLELLAQIRDTESLDALDALKRSASRFKFSAKQGATLSAADRERRAEIIGVADQLHPEFDAREDAP